ncbi:TPA: PLP-dependent aminotransferase family protein [Pseudomonas aeruginosa]|nr:PLP-dependent aminotransferase family protein [Pseudomonas aeruginosa]HBN9885761.1 PLP-dependent aminotransferase family protein [Pseudomonas aeruginosa]
MAGDLETGAQKRPVWLQPLSAGGGPRYLQIADAIARGVREGALVPGDQIPPQRWMAKELGVDLTTVTRAYAEARRRGLLASFGGRGSFIAPPHEALQDSVLDLTMNLPPQTADRALAEHIRTGIEAVLAQQRIESISGYQNLEANAPAQAIARIWLGPLMDDLTESRLLMCAGAQGAIFNLLMTHTQPGDTVLSDELTYPGFLRAAQALGLKVVGIPGDASGIRPDSLEQCQRETGARVLYLNPTIHNPTTLTMPAARRQEIAIMLMRLNMTLIEDDPYRRLANDAPPPITVYTSGSRSYYLASLSKCLWPGLRFAYVVAPSDQATDSLLQHFRASSMGCSPLLASLAQSWIRDGTAISLVAEIQREARARQTMARSMLPADIQAHPSGLHLWLPLPEQWTARTFSQALEGAGFRIAVADAFCVSGRSPEAVRVSVGGARNHSALSAAFRQISALLTKTPSESANMVI